MAGQLPYPARKPLAIDWEQTFRNWSKPSSDDEADRQENALRMVKDAISAYEPLDCHSIKFIPQGSYHNNTNVRQESDVDICVCCASSYFVDFSQANYGWVQGEIDSPYTFFDFKNDVEAALKKKFGTDGYARGSKAFNVHPNGYRVHADVVAAFEYREYLPGRIDPVTGLAAASYTLPEGTKFICDTSFKSVINWPEQHHDKGVSKNLRTGNRFKYIVRALKRLKYYMAENGKPDLKDFPSYLIECLVYCVPDSYLEGDSYYDNVHTVLAHAISGTIKIEDCCDWKEVNEKKTLFGAGQPWTHKEACDFCVAAWNTVGFGK
jgi:hypothetical protein